MVYIPPNDRVRETSTDTGAGDYTLSATSDFLRFSAMKSVDGTHAMANGDLVDYAIILGSDFEVGICPWQTGNILARTAGTVKASSNGGALVSFGAGTKDIFNDAGAHVLNAMLRFDIAQVISEAKKVLARSNVYAAPFDAMGYHGLNINGGMEVSEDKGTAATTLTATNALVATHVIDGCYTNCRGTFVATAQQVTDAPPGFSNSLKISVTTAQASLGANDQLSLQFPIEGTRVSRLALGTGSAASISFAFMVKAHRAGSYSGAVRNSAQTRCWPFSYTVNAADTWEMKTVTIPGDQSGTWIKDASASGLVLQLCVAGGSSTLGTAGAWATTAAPGYAGVTGSVNGVAATTDTFQATGVLVLPGIDLPSSERLPFIMRPKDDAELLCLRLFEKLDGNITGLGFQRLIGTFGSGVTESKATWLFKRRKRAPPAVANPNGQSAGGPDSTTVDQCTISHTTSNTPAIWGTGATADARLF